MSILTIRTIGGWALLINAALMVVLLIPFTASVGSISVSIVIGEVLSVLFVVGLVAISTSQPHTGRLGQVGLLGIWLLGIWLLGIATIIAFLVRLTMLAGSIEVGDFLPLSSALIGLAGSILLGWATIQTKVFHPAIGWLLIAAGVLNFVGGLLPPGAGALLVSIFATILQVGAVGGYGWTMLHSAPTARHAHEQPVRARESGQQIGLK
jgi:hypothetical protein